MVKTVSVITINEIRTVKLTRLAAALVDFLEAGNTPVYTDYSLFLIVRDLYKNPEGLYLRGKTASVENYRRTRNLLLEAKKITQDEDYPGVYRVLSKNDLAADEVTCLLDPFCYISHLSAMQRYGLTDRRPEALHLNIPAIDILKVMIKAKTEQDYGLELKDLPQNEIHRLTIVHHPTQVRKRHVDVFATKNYGRHIRVKGSYSRVSTIGQTFLDMVAEPQKCGGMAHVLDIWQEHAKTYLSDVIAAVENAPKQIHKVRAGYILDEVLKVQKPEIQKWVNFAQRGSSSLLDPTKPFINIFSEKWMISINV